MRGRCLNTYASGAVFGAGRQRGRGGQASSNLQSWRSLGTEGDAAWAADLIGLELRKEAGSRDTNLGEVSV